MIVNQIEFRLSEMDLSRCAETKLVYIQKNVLLIFFILKEK